MEFDLTWLQVDLDVLEENMRKVRARWVAYPSLPTPWR